MFPRPLLDECIKYFSRLKAWTLTKDSIKLRRPNRLKASHLENYSEPYPVPSATVSFLSRDANFWKRLPTSLLTATSIFSFKYQ